jgi:hypothetical protein
MRSADEIILVRILLEFYDQTLQGKEIEKEWNCGRKSLSIIEIH